MSVLMVLPQDVRDYMVVDIDTTSRYSDATITSNILAAQDYLEQKCGRYFVNRPAVKWTIPGATMLRAQVPVPGFRSFTSVTWGGAALTVGFAAGDQASVWAIPDLRNTGVYVGLQFRAWRVEGNPNWYYADRYWWDKALDNPFYPGNWGGGYAWTSMPDDLVIVGDGGYDPAVYVPPAVSDTIKIYAAFKTWRNQSLLANDAITPQGGVLSYARVPAEVTDFIADWKIGGEQVVSM